jgi:hypothetical protein
MSMPFVKSYLDKLIFLESAVGHKTTYQTLDPFHLVPIDSLQIQRAAKRIAQFVGLPDLVFIVALSGQKEHVAAHIRLEHHQEEVLIEVSPDIAASNDALLATLAHEITHKYLHVNNLHVGRSPLVAYENEVFTDIASVFLGLGKLMLNGCETQDKCSEFTAEGMREYAQTSRIGYLDRAQLAFVYLLVCAMRHIPRERLEQGLTPKALEAVRNCEQDYSCYFNRSYHEYGAKDLQVKSLREKIYDTQRVLIGLEKAIECLNSMCISPAESFLEQVHQRLAQMATAAENVSSAYEPDPAMRFLQAMQLDKTIHRLDAELKDHSINVEQYSSGLLRAGESISNLDSVFSMSNPEEFTVVTCRNDGSKLRVRSGERNLLVTCPTCQYEFLADTATYSPKDTKKSRPGRARPTLASILKHLFGRHQSDKRA